MELVDLLLTSYLVFGVEVVPLRFLAVFKVVPLLTNLLGNFGNFSIWIFSSNGSLDFNHVEHVRRENFLWLNSCLTTFFVEGCLLKILAVFTILVDEKAFSVEVFQFLLVSDLILFDDFHVRFLLVFTQSSPNLSKTFCDFSHGKLWVINFELISSGSHECEVAGGDFLRLELNCVLVFFRSSSSFFNLGSFGSWVGFGFLFPILRRALRGRKWNSRLSLLDCLRISLRY